jgi:hypothetical protein
MEKSTYKHKPHRREPKMYLDRSRICCECGNNRTNDSIINMVKWHRDVDEHGKWTGRWKCSKCYQKDYRRKRNEEADIMRKGLIEERNSRQAENIGKDGNS